MASSEWTDIIVPLGKVIPVLPGDNQTSYVKRIEINKVMIYRQGLIATDHYQVR